MTSKRKDVISQIIEYFARLSSAVEINNLNGLTDINHLSEDFFCVLLNKIFQLNLKNLNEKVQNYPAVDLGDKEKKIAFQVTSDATSTKIKKCLKKFKDHNLDEHYSSLKIIVIKSKKNAGKTEITSGCSLVFNRESDVLCLSDLTAIIKGLGDIDRQQEILDFLHKEFDDKNNSSGENFSSEVQTIVDLIDFLSKNKKLLEKKWTEEPDPEKKIHRFGDYKDFLEKEIVRLLPRYSKAKEEVANTLGIDSAQVDFIRDFLRTTSDSFLSDAKNDPKKALDNLTKFLEEKMSVSGRKYDQQAIRFYLLDELVKCNVFPN